MSLKAGVALSRVVATVVSVFLWSVVLKQRKKHNIGWDWEFEMKLHISF